MPVKDIKKISRVGKCSLAVTIPPNWIRYHNLKRGDLVEVVSDDVLTIKPLKEMV